MDVLDMIDRIESILKERNITKGEFYKGCKLTDGAFSQWRTGRSNPSQRSISKISDFLGVPTQYLMYGIEQKEKPTIVSDDRLPIDERTLLSMYRDIPENRKSEALAGFLDLIKKYGNS